MILGTAAYMSPEQAKGRVVDRRTDVWAFGAVLYEMLTGRRAFEGEDVTDTLARILMKEPDWTALPATVPPAMTTVLRRCLQKDPQAAPARHRRCGAGARGRVPYRAGDEPQPIVEQTCTGWSWRSRRWPPSYLPASRRSAFVNHRPRRGACTSRCHSPETAAAQHLRVFS